jgi:gamma-polyglutamate synthase
VPFPAAISICLLVLFGLGLLERFLRNRAWQSVPIRIHVNGTRGKSSVTRLIWSALRQADIPAVAKTTGAAPRLLLPDGSERPLKRRGKPNIREQLRTLLLARRLCAKAVVLECMAIAPELQWAAEHSMAAATIGVITNVRMDHTEVMGCSWDEIAACLSNTVPRQSVLVVGNASLARCYRHCAAVRETTIVVADPTTIPSLTAAQHLVATGPQPAGDSWQHENQSIALAVTRQLGIADEVALTGIRNAPADPGDSTLSTAICGAHSLPCLDARSANDPESFLRTLSAFLPDLEQSGAPTGSQLLVYNHRADRPHRLLDFARVFPALRPAEVLITGDRPALSSWLALRRLRSAPPLRFVSVRRLPSVLAGLAGHCQSLVFCGNTHGLDLSTIVNTQAHG